MKKLLAALVALVAINASAYDVTNTVTIVSNIYNRISEEHWITNNIKNTHTNYHYTNNVYTVSNVTLLVSQTNVNTTATYDMGRSMLSIMSNDVNSAKASIRNTADEAAGSASQASASASSASSSAASAQNTLNNVNTRGSEIINAMNSKQEWFDENYGKMITNHNIYVAEDQVARAGVEQNASDIASLEGRVGDNIQQLTTRMGAAEGNISSLQDSVLGLGSRMNTAEGNITTLDMRIGTAEGNITTLQAEVRAVSNMVENVEVERIVKYTNKNGLFVYDFYVNSVLHQRCTVDSSSAVDYTLDGVNYYDYSFTVESFVQVQYPSIQFFRMVKSNGSFLVRIQLNGMTHTDYNISATNPIDKNILPSAGFTDGSYVFQFVNATKSIDSYLSSDLNIYNSDGTVIDSLSKKSDVDSLRSFAYSLFNSTRIYSPDHTKFISGDLGVYNALYDTQSASVPMSFVGSDGTVLTRIGRQTVLGTVYYYYLSSEDIDAQFITGSNVMPHYNKGMVISYVSASSNWRVVKLINNDSGYSKLVNNLTGGFILKNGTDGHDVTWMDSNEIYIYARGSKIGTLLIQ